MISTEAVTIARTERGLTIVGTRITIYDVMAYRKAWYSDRSIREKLGLTQEQIDIALNYIKENLDLVEAEYQQASETEIEIRQYWENHNRDRFTQLAEMPDKCDQTELREKLKAWKERIEA